MKTYTTISDSSQAAKLLHDHMIPLDHEELWVVFLNSANRVITQEMISMGSLTSTIFDVRCILRRALLNNAANILLVHNHPSGNPVPSTADIKQTEAVSKACKLMEIGLLDHLILSSDSYYSFADEAATEYNF